MLSLKEGIRDYIFHCRYEKNLSSKTISAYNTDLTQFNMFCSQTLKIRLVSSIDRLNLRMYLAHLQVGLKPKSIKRKLASLKAFFNFLEYEEILDINPFRKMKSVFKEPRELPNFLSISEVKAVLKVIYTEKPRVAYRSYKYKILCRDIAILELLFGTGIRVSECCNIRLGDINLQNRWVKVLGKGSRERIIPICSTEISDALLEYLGLVDLEKRKYLFTNRLEKQIKPYSIRLLVNKYCILAGLNRKITPHVFRHTFATLLLEEGVGLRYIQQLLGHSSITTTQIYTHVTQKQQEKVLQSFHPRNQLFPEGLK